MRRERAARREQAGNVRMGLAQAESSGRKVIDARNVSFGYPGRALVRDFSTVIMRGDRVGLIGPNGSGKTTLLKLLLGELAPTQGEVRLGTGLDVVYFDQYRSVLREDWNALDNVADGLDYVDVGGRRKHVLGYLQDFLFSPERARAPITRLSGGERNRLLLAKLFAKPSNLLVMDEPTNDLDVETLELLEEILGEYPGTLLLVSHDRDFLDQVVTSTLVMEGEGRVAEYVGGYSDWVRQRSTAPAPTASALARSPVAVPVVTALLAAAPPRRRLGQKEARELEKLPAQVELIEARIASLVARTQEPDFYRRDGAAIAAHNVELASAQAELEAAYARWQALEDPAA
jgi:ATP-binding cassette subfamily F protein uup